TFPTIAGLLLAGVLIAILGVRWRRSGLPLTDSVRRFLAPPLVATETDNLQASLLLTQAERNRELDGRLRQEHQRAGQLELLASTAHQLAGLTDVQTLLDEATRRLVGAHNFDEAAIYLVEADELVLRSAS